MFLRVCRTLCLTVVTAFCLWAPLAFSEDYFSEREKRILYSLSLHALGDLPASPSNRVADNSIAAALGKELFFDKRLSGNGKFSCATCHQPQNFFTDGLARAVGVELTGRNTPTVVGSAYQQWFYWDGRRDSLWSQALIPFEAAKEMGSTRTAVLRVIAQDSKYLAAYESLFGVFPKALIQSLSADASPLGSAAQKKQWELFGDTKRDVISKTYANLGKAIAAYERSLVFKPTKFDRFVQKYILAGDEQALNSLNAAELRGAKLFLNEEKTQCLQCHNGPLLSNGDFHNVGTGNFSTVDQDFGRVWGIQSVLMDEFNCLGKFSDAKQEACSQLRFLNKDVSHTLYGAFKTPGLRHLKHTAPYFHDGSAKTIPEVIRHYLQPPRTGKNSTHEIREIVLKPPEISYLVAFLLSFDSKDALKFE